MDEHTISRTTVVAVLVATVAALFARSWLQIELLHDGMNPRLAKDLSYLVVPPILLFLLFPLWPSQKQFLRDQFRFSDLGWPLVMRAFAIGVLIRLLWWSQLIAGSSFGFYVSTDPNSIVGPVFSFQCASPEIVLVGFVVMVFLVPLIEEIINRGFIQTSLNHRRLVTAIVISSAVFTVFHQMDGWPIVFFAGLVFGMQYGVTQSLWSSLVTHATVNGLIQIDWLCLSGHWNPIASDRPVLLPGILAITVFTTCLLALITLLFKMAAETRTMSRQPPVTER